VDTLTEEELAGIDKIPEMNKLYSVEPTKVIIFFKEIMCRMTTTKFVPLNSDIRTQYAIVDEANPDTPLPALEEGIYPCLTVFFFLFLKSVDF